MKGTLYTGITEDKSTRIFVAITTDMVEKARKIHMLTPLATAGLGRVITATAIMGSTVKGDNQSVSLSFQGDGIVKKIMAISWKPGYVKGYISNPDGVLPPRKDGKINVGGALGKGYVTVIKDLGLKEPFIGRSRIVTGEIAEDLAAYFMHSEQQPSVISLGVCFDKNTAKVSGAGGIFIQPLPDAEEGVLEKIEKDISNLPPISQMVASGESGESIMKKALNSFSVKLTGQSELIYVCDCSQERIERALVSLDKRTLKTLIDEDEQAELHCHFCNQRYFFSKKDLIHFYEKKK